MGLESGEGSTGRIGLIGVGIDWAIWEVEGTCLDKTGTKVFESCNFGLETDDILVTWKKGNDNSSKDNILWYKFFFCLYLDTYTLYDEGCNQSMCME